MMARLAAASTSLDIATLFVVATCVTGAARYFPAVRLDAGAGQGARVVGNGLSDRRILRRVMAARRHRLAAVAVGHRRCTSVHRRRHDLECGALISRPAGALGRHVLRRRCVARHVHVAAGADMPADRIIVQLDHCRHLYLPDRRRTVARAPQNPDPALAGTIRADVARHDFFFPVALASLGVRNLATGWVAVFAIEVVLYVVGAAFIVLVLAKDRTVHRYKVAAETDPLTALLNRRGFLDARGNCHDRQHGPPRAGQCAGVRSRPLQIDQRSIRTQNRRCRARVCSRKWCEKPCGPATSSAELAARNSLRCCPARWPMPVWPPSAYGRHSRPPPLHLTAHKSQRPSASAWPVDCRCRST